MVTLTVAIPCHRNCPMGFVIDAWQLAERLAELRGLGALQHSETVFWNGTVLPHMRQRLVDTALSMDATHMLWIDTDMRFPRNTFERLLAHDKDIVAINARTREQDNPRFIAKRFAKGGGFDRVPTRLGSRGLERVDVVPFGVVLVTTEVLKRMARPHFKYKYDKTGTISSSEDGYFCLEAGKAGAELWLDHDLSKECAHIGDFEYRVNHPGERHR